jgi:hypothetical protein
MGFRNQPRTYDVCNSSAGEALGVRRLDAALNIKS